MKTIKKLFVIMLFGIAVLPAAAQEGEEMDPGESRLDARGIEQVWVPAGCFMMGTSDAEAEYARSLDGPGWAKGRLRSEQPQHEVCITQGFWIDKHEVTNEAFQAFVDDDGYATEAYWSEDGWAWLNRQNIEELPVQCVEEAASDHPRVCITWYEAEAYANWRGGALPTEAQWEYAARGPESTIFPWGNEWDPELANVLESEGLTSVGTYEGGVSWVGAYDMAGNAMEWVQDWLDDRYYIDSPKDDPPGPETGRRKAEKGGWWGSNPVVARSAYKHFEDPPTYQDHHIGVRVASPAESSDE